MKEGEAIKDLFSHWVAYSDKRSNYSIKDFSKWLYTKLNPIEETDTRNMREKKMELGHMFGRLSNFAQLWGKLAFKDLPIRHFEDFGVLSGVKYMDAPSKNEIVNLLLNEKSTAFEIIKRLVRDGLLMEEIGKEDKRIRTVKLTPYGEEIFKIAELQTAKVSQLLMGDSSDEEILELLEKLKELNRFHTNKYEKGGFDTIEDVLD